MEVSLEGMLEKARTASVLLQALGGVPIPASIQAATRGEWLTAIEAAGEEILGSLPAADFAKGKTKVIRIEDAHFILGKMEENILTHYVRSPESPVVKAFNRLGRTWKFVLLHARELYSVFLPLAGGVMKGVGKLAMANFWANLWALGEIQAARDGRTLSEYDKRLADEAFANRDIEFDKLEAMMAGFIGIIAYYAVEELIAAAASVEVLREQLRPVADARNLAVELALRFALPQKRGRVRRRKQAR